MLNIKIIIKKYKGKSTVWILGLIVTIWISSLLTPLFTGFNQYLLDKAGAPVSSLIFFLTSALLFQVPVYSILVFTVVVWFIYKTFNKITLSRRELKIVKAEYGSGTTFTDVTSQLNDLVIDNKLTVTLSNGIPGFDPTPGVLKYGKIKYEYDNKVKEKKVTEGKEIVIP